MINSPEIEKRVLSGLIQNPDEWGEICDYLVVADFYEGGGSKVHSSIFRLIKQAFDNTEIIDEVLLIQRMKDLNVSFPDNIELPEYIRSLTAFKVNPDILRTSVRELKKLTARRELWNGANELAMFAKKESSELKYSDIVIGADKIYHKRLEQFERADSGPVNLFKEKMEALIEDRGNNPITEFGMMGPYPRINDLYGSLLLAGNISVVVARSAVGKTTLALDYSTKTAEKYNVPVIHFDNGEMSEEELIFRQCSAVSGVPMWLLQTGKWRTSSYGDWSSEEVVRRVRESFKSVKTLDFYYENVAGLSPDELNALLKKIYYSKVGRGKPAIFSFDYIKTDFTNMDGSGWMQVAYMVHKFKQTIQREVVTDGKPMISMFTSVQANRSGITTNRTTDKVVEDESVVGLADMIIQYCSHMFLLRRKTLDEVHAEKGMFGTHKMINLKARHLGEDFMRAIEDVAMPNGEKKKNYVNFDFKNFQIEERGDLVDYVNAINNSTKPYDGGDEDLPELLRND
jgi:replicative DNA helicase